MWTVQSQVFIPKKGFKMRLCEKRTLLAIVLHDEFAYNRYSWRMCSYHVTDVQSSKNSQKSISTNLTVSFALTLTVSRDTLHRAYHFFNAWLVIPVRTVQTVLYCSLHHYQCWRFHLLLRLFITGNLALSLIRNYDSPVHSIINADFGLSSSHWSPYCHSWAQWLTELIP